MRLLVTGICGFVGSTLTRCFLEMIEGIEISGIDNLIRRGSELNRRSLPKSGCKIIYGDVRSRSDLDQLPLVDWVIDAAALPSVSAGLDGSASSRQAVEHNLLGTLNVLEYCRRSSAGLILLSTSRVYSIPALCSLPLSRIGNRFEPDATGILPIGLSSEGISENFSTAAPISLYGATKLSSEVLALEYGRTFQFPVWIDRCGARRRRPVWYSGTRSFFFLDSRLAYSSAPVLHRLRRKWFSGQRRSSSAGSGRVGGPATW